MKDLKPSDFVSLNEYEGNYPIKIHLAYSRDEIPNIFGKIYKDEAQLWLHEDLAEIVLRASVAVKDTYGYGLVLYDGLRTMEAQAKMQEAPIVKANPHWLESPGRLLSPPGAGAHPRGMAIDLTLMDEDEKLLPMGTVFDHLSEDSTAAHNPAHREYKDHPLEVHQNRTILNNAMLGAAEKLGMALLPLPQEWWDFRFTPEVYEEFNPLSDQDLPDTMKMV